MSFLGCGCPDGWPQVRTYTAQFYSTGFYTNPYGYQQQLSGPVRDMRPVWEYQEHALPCQRRNEFIGCHFTAVPR